MLTTPPEDMTSFMAGGAPIEQRSRVAAASDRALRLDTVEQLDVGVAIAPLPRSLA